MRYRIEYASGRCCNFANSRTDLIDWLKLLKDETITDIRKLYKSGESEYLINKNTCRRRDIIDAFRSRICRKEEIYGKSY